MPRSPDPKSKTCQIVIRATTIDETNKITALKEIVARNREMSINSTFRYGKPIKGEGIKMVEWTLRKHNWPPGNSQTLLKSFGSELSLICVYCGKGGFKTLRKVTTPGGEMSVCKSCYEDLKFRRLIKK